MYYLMIKEIDQTGLKYLCKRKQSVKDPEDHLKYRGSGVLWRRILNKHPEYTVTTTVIGLFTADDLKEKGLYYSELYNIVESKEWANLINEVGDGGDTSQTEGYQKYLSSRGYIPSPFKGSRAAHNPSTGKGIRLNATDALPEGFVEGNVRGTGTGPKPGTSSVYHNGSTKIYVKHGEPIPEGFVKGVHYEGTTKGRRGCYHPETKHKRYLAAHEELPVGYVYGVPPTTSKAILTPHGRFSSVAECMNALGLTRHAIQSKIKTEPNWSYE